MKAKSLFFPLVFVLLVSTVAAQDSAIVTRVKDGNTFGLKNGKKVFWARLLKADAPDMRQFWGRNAFGLVYQKIQGKVIQYDSVGKDNRKRVLINARYQGKRLDSLFIINGWAWHDVNNDNEAMLDNAMSEATTNHFGLWLCGSDKVCPPWIYRTYSSKERAKHCKGCKIN